jgi:hypothetical protein
MIEEAAHEQHITGRHDWQKPASSSPNNTQTDHGPDMQLMTCHVRMDTLFYIPINHPECRSLISSDAMDDGPCQDEEQ